MKSCRNCGKRITVVNAEHRSRTKGDVLRATRCRDCRKIYYKKYYKKNKVAIKAKIARYHNRLRTWVAAYKISRPCKDCKQRFDCSEVLEFDHKNGNKDKEVSVMVLHRGLVAIKKEIAKCDLVCANCHRIRTWKRRNKAKVA